MSRVPRTRCRISPLRGATGRRLVTVERWPAAASVSGTGVIADTVSASPSDTRHRRTPIDGSEYSVHITLPLLQRGSPRVLSLTSFVTYNSSLLSICFALSLESTPCFYSLCQLHPSFSVSDRPLPAPVTSSSSALAIHNSLTLSLPA